jgi:alkanesulfonate monooxygenase SsuD/methylene tetrahydromethanopterin reductase-like flavin-dependent oxidoreductase (luciferase family)
VKFGVFDHVDWGGAPLDRHFEDRLALVEAYDRLGFHGYHVAEHHGTPLGTAPSPSLYLAAVAQRTSRIRIGPLVYLLPLYHPLRLIEEVCMLDQMSRGRLMLGIGRGVSPIEAGFFGNPPEGQQALYDETLEILLKGLTSERLDHDGAQYRLRDVPMTLRPFQQPHPELWYGVSSPESTLWAARNRVNVVTLAAAARARPTMDLYKGEWAALGRPADDLPLMGLSRHIVVADSEEAAQAIAGHAYRVWRASFIKLWVDRGHDPARFGYYPEEWVQMEASRHGCAGTPDKVVRYINEEIGTSGCNYLVSSLVFGDMTRSEALRSAELLAGEVMPHCSAANLS